MPVIITLAVIALIVLWWIATYNSLVRLRENVRSAWSQIDVQLKRRHDLIDNIVEVAKGYLKHERETLENVIKARQQAINADSLKNREEAENFLSSTLRSLFAVSENYPQLKADRQMIQLHEEITSTENRITFARQYYNDEVNRLNTSVQSFPNSIIAQSGNFTKAEFFELSNPVEKEVPKVKF